jgi:type I restriction enzyme, S subunit
MSCQLRKLGDVLEFCYGKSLPDRERKAGDIPVYGSGGIGGYHNEALISGPGVIVGRKGSVGAVFFESRDFFPIDTVYYVVPKGDEISLRYAYYLLKHLPLASMNSDVAVPGLNRDRALSLEVQLPKRNEQNAIVSILYAYDDLIENNRRRMVLLEESARLLYNEWFVRLRFPGYEHTPIVDGVPDGWEKVKVGSLLAKISKGSKIQKNDYFESGPIPCIDQGANFIGGYTDNEDARISNPLPLIVFGDHTRVLKFVSFPFASGADGTQLIYPNTQRISPEYFYFALKAIDLSNYFYARHFKFLKEESVTIPADVLVREFSKFAASNFEQINNLRIQNQKLRAARDLLLPRLMSGEIAV